ncbi:MAG: Putative transmembrane protein [uncultured Paraburkholderia sp.]|nr:MAG: Putative transmembrane protein [uncultured Paraburkholderia sp.]CAH2945159.1 MAG: Putative transmembrane protein [uncultured Paraburkholderia sp.]
MLLATRCPFCEAVFRLQPAQLALRRGLVRCGHCQEVFDASSSLYDVSGGGDFSTAKPVAAAAAIEALSGVRSDGPNFSGEAWDPWAPAPGASIDDRLLHNARNVPLQAVSTDAGIAVTPKHQDEPPPAAPTPAPSASVTPEHEPVLADAPLEPFAYEDHAPAEEAPRVWHKTERASDEPFSVNPVHSDTDLFPVTREMRPAEPRRIGWLVGGWVIAALLIVALLAQLAWWQRETVLIYMPSSQALYAKVCEQLNCQIMPPHDIDGLQVEPSDFRQIDGPHKLELKMPLRNRFNVPLAYPAIELTLLDEQNNVAVRRVLWPQNYVPPGTPIAAGLPPRSTQTMIVHLDTGNAVASNFRVQISYP